MTNEFLRTINNGAIFTKQKYKLPELVEFIKKIAKEKEND